MPTRDQALALLHEYTKSESLIKHGLAVEAAMGWYARHFAQNSEAETSWRIAGLLHDFDYERFPIVENQQGHPFTGNQILTELGYSDEIRRAIMGHALYSGVPRDTLIAKTLFAVDELTGLVTAAVYVRPDRSIHTLEVPSVTKRMKDKTFAKGCNREEIKIGAEDLGIELPLHIGNVIQALREVADTLGLAGSKL